MAAFATGVLPNIYEFHLYTGNSTILSGTQACQPPTRPLRPVIPNNASPLRITAAAGTKLAGASSHATVIIESGPCLSPSVADHPLRPATDRRLASVSRRYSEPKGRFPRVTHPCATKAEAFVRLACVRHAASVRSEPGSNSQFLCSKDAQTILIVPIPVGTNTPRPQRLPTAAACASLLTTRYKLVKEPAALKRAAPAALPHPLFWRGSDRSDRRISVEAGRLNS
ncbi:hypothetical protein Lal_00005293 [Lupinus albus]|nr:hypothetical protein Lal_00005293 [Lupinus albus]